MKKLFFLAALFIGLYSNAQNPILGNTDRQKVTTFEMNGPVLEFQIENDELQAVDLVAGLDAHFGNTDWRSGGLSNIVEDTSPQLGGALDMNGQTVTGDVMPTMTLTYDLGNSSNRWEIGGFNNLYATTTTGTSFFMTTGNINNLLLNPTDTEPTSTKGRIYFDDSEGTLKQYNGSAWEALNGGGGSGDVTAASAFGTDNRLIRSDGTGKGVQASPITVSDAGAVSGMTLDADENTVSNIGSSEVDLTDDYTWTGTHTFNLQIQMPSGFYLSAGNGNYGDSRIYQGEDNGTSGKRWYTQKDQSSDSLEWFFQDSDETSTAGTYSKLYSLNDSGTPTDATDLVDRAYADGLNADKENLSNKATTLDSPNDTKYPSTEAVAEAIGELNLLGEEDATATRNAAITDANGMVNVNSATDVTITIQANATTAFPVGTVLSYFQENTGDVLIAYDGGVTGEAARTFGSGQKIVIWQTATDVWQVITRPATASVTSAEYAALSSALQNNGTAYFLTD